MYNRHEQWEYEVDPSTPKYEGDPRASWATNDKSAFPGRPFCTELR